MELTTLGRALPRFRTNNINFQVPLYVTIPVFVFFAALLLTFACITFAKQAVPLNPLSAYADILPGSPLRNAVAHGFLCFHIPVPYSANVSVQCVHNSQTGKFSHVNVMIWDGIITQLIFTVQENTLRVGDLFLLWGKPEIESWGYLSILKWPAYGVAATAPIHAGRYTHFSPISSVWFPP